MADETEPDAGEDALTGDGERPSSDPQGVDDPADPVDEDDRVRGFGSYGRSGGPHGDSDIGKRQRRSVVDAVADHHDGTQLGVLLDGADELQLLLRRLLGVHTIDADVASDLVRDAGPIAGCHRDVADARLSQVFHELLCIGAKVVGHDDRAGQLTLDADEDLRSTGAVRRHRARARRPAGTG